MTDARPERGPWSAVLVERQNGYGVVVRLDVDYPTPEQATAAGQALLGQMDTRLEALGRRLREVVDDPLAELPRPAPTPTFRAP